MAMFFAAVIVAAFVIANFEWILLLAFSVSTVAVFCFAISALLTRL